MKKKPVLSFTVKLSKWRCGGHSAFADNKLGIGATFLINPEGYKCCLGFACQAAGFRGRLTDIANPSHLKREVKGLSIRNHLKRSHNPLVSDFFNTEFTNDAIRINDDPSTTIEHKQQKLIELGKQHNIEIKFIP